MRTRGITRNLGAWAALLLSAHGALGQTTGGPPDFSPPSGGKVDSPQVLLEKGIRSFEGHRSLSAQIRHRASLLGRNVVGGGSYLEQRSEEGLRLRLELKTQVGEETSSLLQVCDGRYLWTCRTAPRVPETVSRIAVIRVATVLEQIGDAQDPGKIGAWLGLGGVPRLLRSLHANFEFLSAEPGQLDRKPIVRLSGSWRPEKLALLLPSQAETIQAGGSADTSKLPEHLPDRVVICLGQSNLFPYQIEYGRSHAHPKQRYPLPADGVLLTLELFDEVFDVPIHPSRFAYSPGKLEVDDQTEEFVKSLAPKR